MSLSDNQRDLPELSKDPAYIYWIAFDPGGTTGWALFARRGTEDPGLLMMGQIPGGATGLATWLNEFSDGLDLIKNCIYEEYAIFKRKAMSHAGSKVETAQCVGVIKNAAVVHKWELVAQKPQILPIAELWTGVKIPGNHTVSHQISAFLHGSYYLIQKNLMKTKQEYEHGRKV